MVTIHGQLACSPSTQKTRGGKLVVEAVLQTVNGDQLCLVAYSRQARNELQNMHKGDPLEITGRFAGSRAVKGSNHRVCFSSVARATELAVTRSRSETTDERENQQNRQYG